MSTPAKPTSKPTINVYVAVGYTDSTGTRKEGEQITLPYGTDAEKAEVQGMIAYGVLSTERQTTRPRSAR